MRQLNEKEMALRVDFNKKVEGGIKKSDLFRQMYDQGMNVGDISKVTDCHYSFVYGVISESREIVKKEGESKSDKIRSLVDQGKSAGEIAKELNSNYSFVFSVVKKYKKDSEKKVI